jgi:predicted dinucleotide-binding enzyme
VVAGVIGFSIAFSLAFADRKAVIGSSESPE